MGDVNGWKMIEAENVNWRSGHGGAGNEPLKRGSMGIAVPNAHLRAASSVADLGKWFAIGEAWAHIAVEFSPTDSPRILDIGCGCAKMARFFFMNPRVRYVGLDVYRPAIEWCCEAFQQHKRFSFLHLDAKSSLYNPKGSLESDTVTLPVPSQTFDLAICGSLLTHLLETTFRRYMAELARVLATEGRAVVSIHNQPLGKFSGDETRIDVSDQYFVEIVTSVGLHVEALVGRVFGQQVYILAQAAGNSHHVPL